MSDLRFTVRREDVSDRDIWFWHGPSSYTLDSLTEWREKNGDPYHVAETAWRLAIFEVHYPDDWEADTGPQFYEVYDQYYEHWEDAMADGCYILKEPRSIEGPDRAWERDYYLNANKV
jgi:hypothetical protein